jgi:hypothetical protein
MNENKIGDITVNCAVKVPMQFGPGLLKSDNEVLMKDGIFRIVNGKLECPLFSSLCLRASV